MEEAGADEGLERSARSRIMLERMSTGTQSIRFIAAMVSGTAFMYWDVETIYHVLLVSRLCFQR